MMGYQKTTKVPKKLQQIIQRKLQMKMIEK